jgi:hypothetical protein
VYGHGEREFTRLQEEIIKISDDHSIFAWDVNLVDSYSIRGTSFLAPSPSCFRRGAYVVPFGKNHSQDSPYALTNKGLQIQLPIFRKPEPESEVIYGLISCHWENTWSGCIGIPLHGTTNSLFFERSIKHHPETISQTDMACATVQTIFLSTRAKQVPFAAEMKLQVTDSCLSSEGFKLVIRNHPLASCHWYPTYQIFTLSWLTGRNAFGKEVRDIFVDLVWYHGSKELPNIALGIYGTINGLGEVKFLNIQFTSNINSESIDSSARQSPRETSQTSDLGVMTAECPLPGSSTMVSAKLLRLNLFGNDVYTLSLNCDSIPSEGLGTDQKLTPAS